MIEKSYRFSLSSLIVKNSNVVFQYYPRIKPPWFNESSKNTQASY